MISDKNLKIKLEINGHLMKLVSLTKLVILFTSIFQLLMKIMSKYIDLINLIIMISMATFCKRLNFSSILNSLRLAIKHWKLILIKVHLVEMENIGLIKSLREAQIGLQLELEMFH